MEESWRQERSLGSDTFMGRSCWAPQLSGTVAVTLVKSQWADGVPSREAGLVGGDTVKSSILYVLGKARLAVNYSHLEWAGKAWT